jgi:hypothetical protein
MYRILPPRAGLLRRLRGYLDHMPHAALRTDPARMCGVIRVRHKHHVSSPLTISARHWMALRNLSLNELIYSNCLPSISPGLRLNTQNSLLSFRHNIPLFRRSDFSQPFRFSPFTITKSKILKEKTESHWLTSASPPELSIKSFWQTLQ